MPLDNLQGLICQRPNQPTNHGCYSHKDLATVPLAFLYPQSPSENFEPDPLFNPEVDCSHSAVHIKLSSWNLPGSSKFNPWNHFFS